MFQLLYGAPSVKLKYLFDLFVIASCCNFGNSVGEFNLPKTSRSSPEVIMRDNCCHLAACGRRVLTADWKLARKAESVVLK